VKLWYVAYCTVVRNLRDVKMMVAFTLFPIILVIIVGSSLDRQITPQNIMKESAGIYYSDTGPQAEAGRSIENSLRSGSYPDMMTLERAATLEDGIENIRNGAWNALLVLVDGKRPGVEGAWQVYTGKGGSLAAPVLEGLAAGAETGTPDGGKVPYTAIPLSEGIISGIDYYSVATLLQFVLMGGLLGILSVSRDLADGTYLRQLTAPVSPRTILWGKAAGAGAVLFLDCILVVLILKFGMNANWQGNWLFILSILLIFSFISILLGMVLAIWTRSAVLATVALFPVMMIFTLTAGGFSKELTPALEAVGRFSPNTYATRALIGHMFGGEGQSPGSSALYLLFYAAAVAVLFMLSARRKPV
jgi:ABC-2 type transport system permease protein